MFSSQRALAQIRSFFAPAASALRAFAADLARLLARAQAALDGRLGKAPPGRRKSLAAAACAAIAVLAAAVFAAGRAGEWRAGRPGWDAPPPAGRPAQRNLIPQEELFLPDEPDFAPGVLLGRERRAQWSAEDAEPWWQNPLAGGEEQWRARIEQMADEIMESVP